METYNNIVKNLIEMNIDFEQIRQLMYIINRVGIKSIEEWNEVFNYLKKYTERTQECHEDWPFERTVDLYYRYLKTFERINVSLFPKEDMYYILQEFEYNMYFAKDKAKEQALKMSLEKLAEEECFGNFMGD